VAEGFRKGIEVVPSEPREKSKINPEKREGKEKEERSQR